jgi:hypothetical protein
MAYADRAFLETDLSDVYAAVRVPTLVLYRETPNVPETAEESRTVAHQIPGARLMRVSGGDYYWGVFLSLDAADELERFVGGETAPVVPESVLPQEPASCSSRARSRISSPAPGSRSTTEAVTS